MSHAEVGDIRIPSVPDGRRKQETLYCAILIAILAKFFPAGILIELYGSHLRKRLV